MTPPVSILAITNMFPTDKNPASGVFVEEQINGLRAIGLKVEVFRVDRAGQGMSVYFRMRNSLNAAVQAFQPSVLHVMYGGVMADQVTRRNWQRPTVVTFHGSDLLGENQSGPWRRWISRYGVHCSLRAARNAQGVIVVSRRLRQALPPDLDDDKVRVIPCGINLDRFKPMNKDSCRKRLGWDDDFHVLFVSNNGDPVKRPWLATAAVNLLNASGESAELHIMQGIANSEAPVWMNAADVLLLTSAHEGSPTVVKEALACGLPVVSVDVGDVSERIEGIAGCHLAAADPKQLAAKMLSVKGDGNRVDAREQIKELGVQRVALHLEQVYSEVLSRWNRAAVIERAQHRIKPDVVIG